jgi:hypothetical protein
MDEGARALAIRIGDRGQAFFNQFAGAGAPCGEVIRKARERPPMMILH